MVEREVMGVRMQTSRQKCLYTPLYLIDGFYKRTNFEIKIILIYIIKDIELSCLHVWVKFVLNCIVFNQN